MITEYNLVCIKLPLVTEVMACVAIWAMKNATMVLNNVCHTQRGVLNGANTSFVTSPLLCYSTIDVENAIYMDSLSLSLSLALTYYICRDHSCRAASKWI